MQDLPLDVQLAGDINAAISEDNEVLICVICHSMRSCHLCNQPLFPRAANGVRRSSGLVRNLAEQW